jgi:hypothetical protein
MPEKPNKLMPALYGGIIMGVISGLPFLNLLNCFCCAGILLGGFLAVLFYTREAAPGTLQLTSGDALQLGVLAGVFGAFIETALNAAVLGSVGNVVGETLRQVLEGMADQIPSEVFDQIDRAFGGIAAFTPIAIFFSFIKSIIINPVFGLLGGLIGYAVFKPKPAAVPPQPPVTTTPQV